MRTRRAPPRTLAVAAIAILIAPLLVADQKPTVPRSPYRTDPGPVLSEPGEGGWGKGTVQLPSFEQDGMLVGVLCENEGQAVYSIDALLTGCIPSKVTGSDAQYWFGGLYGVVHEDPGGRLLDREEARGLAVEGTWWRVKGDRGRFSAQVWGCNQAGIEYVCGVLEGSFDLAPPDAEAPKLGAEALDPAWQGPESKKRLGMRSPFRDLPRPDCVCPVEPYALAKQGKQPVAPDAPDYRTAWPNKPRTGVAGKHLRDRRSIPDDCICPVDPFTPVYSGEKVPELKDPWTPAFTVGRYVLATKGAMPYPAQPDYLDAARLFEPPSLSGSFLLRYRLFE
jgi:hypothetical protein